MSLSDKNKPVRPDEGSHTDKMQLPPDIMNPPPYAIIQTPPYSMHPSSAPIYPGSTCPYPYPTYGQNMCIVVAASDNTSPPKTTPTLVIAICTLILSMGGWPFAIIAIVLNRRAKSEVRLGQNMIARGTLRTVKILLVVAIVIDIIGWIFFAFRLKYALEEMNRLNGRY